MIIEQLHEHLFVFQRRRALEIRKFNRKLILVKQIKTNNVCFVLQLSSKFIAIGLHQSIQFYDPDTFHPIAEIPFNDPQSIHELNDGRIAIGLQDARILIYDFHTCKQFKLQPFVNHCECDFSTHHTYVDTCNNCHKSLIGYNAIKTVLPINSLYLVALYTNQIIIWNLETYQGKQINLTSHWKVQICVYSQDEFVYNDGASLYLYNVQTNTRKPFLDQCRIDLMIILRNRQIATTTIDKRTCIRLWNLQTGQITNRESTEPYLHSFQQIAEIEDQIMAVSGRFIHQFHIDSKKHVVAFLSDSPTQPIQYIKPLSKQFVVLGYENHFYLWNRLTQKIGRAFRGQFFGQIRLNNKTNHFKFVARLYDYLVDYLPKDLHSIVGNYLV